MRGFISTLNSVVKRVYSGPERGNDEDETHSMVIDADFREEKHEKNTPTTSKRKISKWNENDMLPCLHDLVVNCKSGSVSARNNLRPNQTSSVPSRTVLSRGLDFARSRGYDALDDMPIGERALVSLEDLAPFAQKRKGGAKRYFTADQEHVLATILFGFATYGKAQSVDEAIATIHEIAGTWNVEFRTRGPLSHHFMTDFVRRHEFLCIRKAVILDSTRRAAACNVRPFFQHVEHLLKDIDPRLLGNIDETGCVANGRGIAVIANKISQSAHIGGSESLQPHITVAPLITAAGDLLRTLYVTGTRTETRVAPHIVNDGDAYAPSSSGFVDTPIFSAFQRDYVVPSIHAYRRLHGLDDKKFYLLLDGHASHQGEPGQIWEMDDADDVVVVRMPSHTSHLIQPLDRAFFGSFKAELRRRITALNVYLDTISVQRRIETIRDVLHAVATRNNGSVIKSSFHHAGFVPWNPERCFDRSSRTLSPRFTYNKDGSATVNVATDIFAVDQPNSTITEAATNAPGPLAVDVPPDNDVIIRQERLYLTKTGKRAWEATTVAFVPSARVAGILKDSMEVLTNKAKRIRDSEPVANPSNVFFVASDPETRRTEDIRIVNQKLSGMNRDGIIKFANKLGISSQRGETRVRCQRKTLSVKELKDLIMKKDIEDIKAALGSFCSSYRYFFAEKSFAQAKGWEGTGALSR